MSGLISPLARSCYGLARVCSAWAFARSTFYAQAAPPADPLLPTAKIHATRGPKTAFEDDALLALLRAELAASPFTGEGRGWHGCKTGDRCAAWEPLARAIATTQGGVPNAARGIQLRHDPGSQYLTHSFHANARCHGFAPSSALLDEPETHGVGERFHRPLKEQIIPVRSSQNLAELRAAVAAFIPT